MARFHWDSISNRQKNENTKEVVCDELFKLDANMILWPKPAIRRR